MQVKSFTEIHKGRLFWARRDTRWDVYPQQEPIELIAHNWEGFWSPLPDGSWFLTPVSYNLVEPAFSPALNGRWGVSEKLHHYLRAQGDEDLF